MSKLAAGLPFLLVPIAIAARPRAPFQAPDELAELMPEQSLAYAEGPRLAELLASGLEHPFVAAVLDSELARAALADAPLSVEDALALADAFAGRPVLAAAARSCANGVALSADVRRGKPVAALALRADDAAFLRETVLALLARAAERHGLERDALSTPHEKVRGADVWHLGDQLSLALAGDVLLASNDEVRLRDMLDLGATPDAERASLAEREDFRRARAARDADALLWSWVDLAGIETRTPRGAEKLRALARDPGAHFLLGPAIAALGSAREAAAEIVLADDRLALEIAGFGVADGAPRRVLFPLEAEAPPMPRAQPSDGGAAIVYRDLAGLFRERTELFPAEVLPKFSEAIANLAFVFGGADVSDEILPGLSPWIALVAREPTFRDAAAPDIALPGVVALARVADPELAGERLVADPELAGERLVAAFQSLVGFMNIDGAQKMRPTLLLDVEIHGGVKISSARFPKPGEGEGVDMRYNLEPACALVGDTFVLGTHVSLVRGVVDQLARGETSAPAAASERLVLSGPVLARTVHANREALVMNAVLNEGKDAELARSEVGALEELARLVRSLELTTTRPAEDELRARFVLALAPAEER